MSSRALPGLCLERLHSIRCEAHCLVTHARCRIRLWSLCLQYGYPTRRYVPLHSCRQKVNIGTTASLDACVQLQAARVLSVSPLHKDEMMEYVTLGKTGLRVSVAGLGCGGNSRLGLGRGKTEAEAIALVRQALDLGLNLLDTASAYGTEALIGKAIKTVPRDCVVITTKALINRGSTPSRPCGSWRASSALCVSSTPTTLTYSNCMLSRLRCMTTRSRLLPLPYCVKRRKGNSVPWVLPRPRRTTMSSAVLGVELELPDQAPA